MNRDSQRELRSLYISLCSIGGEVETCRLQTVKVVALNPGSHSLRELAMRPRKTAEKRRSPTEITHHSAKLG